MAKIWRNRLIACTQLFEDCPVKYREAVIELLRKDVQNGVITEERYEEIVGEEY